MIIIGEKEVNANMLNVRKHGGEDLGSMSLDQFIEHFNEELGN